MLASKWPLPLLFSYPFVNPPAQEFLGVACLACNSCRDLSASRSTPDGISNSVPDPGPQARKCAILIRESKLKAPLIAHR